MLLSQRQVLVAEELLKVEHAAGSLGLVNHYEDDESHRNALLVHAPDLLDRDQNHGMTEVLLQMETLRSKDHLLSLVEHVLHLD